MQLQQDVQHLHCALLCRCYVLHQLLVLFGVISARAASSIGQRCATIPATTQSPVTLVTVRIQYEPIYGKDVAESIRSSSGVEYSIVGRNDQDQRGRRNWSSTNTSDCGNDNKHDKGSSGHFFTVD